LNLSTSHNLTTPRSCTNLSSLVNVNVTRCHITDRQTDKQTRQTERERDRQSETDGETDKQTDKQLII